MRHASCARRLSQYVDDTLDPGVRRAMDKHIAHCSECHDEVVSLRETVHLLHCLAADSEPPADFSARLMARIEQGEADPSRLDRWLAGLRSGLDSSWGPPLATATFGMVLFVLVQGVEIQVTLPGFGGQDVPAASEPVRVASEPVLVPIEPARGPLASRRRPAVLPVMPPFSACVGRPTDPDCARWNMWLVGLGMREPKDFLREVDLVPAGSRARWLGELSRFAAHSGSAAVLATRLRETGDPRARGVAVHFERTAAMGRSTSSSGR